MDVNTNEHYLETIEIETRTPPSHSVIWLHGLGADGNDFVPVTKQLSLPDIGIRFVFPHAPLMPVSINGGFVMRAWYDILDPGLNQEDEHGVRESQTAVVRLLDREISRGIPASCIVLAGFSQGGAIALHTGLRYAHKLAGLMALSAYLPLPSKLSLERNAVNQLTPILMAHGTLDNVVPMSRASVSRDRLAEAGYGIDWHEYPMMHAVCGEELADIGDWLTRILL